MREIVIDLARGRRLRLTRLSLRPLAIASTAANGSAAGFAITAADA